jgi:hypothetical protein
MRTTEHAYGWEVNGLARRLDALEERLNRRDRERLQNAVLVFWTLWGVAIGAMVVLAALN